MLANNDLKLFVISLEMSILWDHIKIMPLSIAEV